MKIINNIGLAFLVLLLVSCVTEWEITSDIAETRGQIAIQIQEKEGEEIDKMETVRFLVFKEPAASPKLELNELFTIPAVSPGEPEVSKFEIILEVSKKKVGTSDKMVVAIINEPSTMKNRLDQLYDYNELAGLELGFSDFLTPDHSSLQNDKTMPMTGVVWTDKVYATSQEAMVDPAEMGVLRTVACVEVYIRKQAGVSFDLGIGSKIILGNTYDKEYFVRNRDDSLLLGNIQTITSGFITKEWTASAAGTIPDVTSGSDGLFVCSFYTPERTCTAPGNADKLTLDITALSSQSEARNGIAILDELSLNNVKTTISNIERNNIYRVIITVIEKGMFITVTVLDWSEQNIIVEF